MARPEEGEKTSPWTDEETRRFLASTRSSPCGPYWSLRAATGLPATEVLALRWDDVDWQRGAVRVSRHMDHGWGWRGLETIPNDQRRAISITVPEAMMAMLHAHTHAQRAFRRAAGPAWHEHGVVLTTVTGTPASMQTLTHELRRLIAHAAVPCLSTSAVVRVDGLVPVSEREHRSAAEALDALFSGHFPRHPPAT